MPEGAALGLPMGHPGLAKPCRLPAPWVPLGGSQAHSEPCPTPPCSWLLFLLIQSILSSARHVGSRILTPQTAGSLQDVLWGDLVPVEGQP